MSDKEATNLNVKYIWIPKT